MQMCVLPLGQEIGGSALCSGRHRYVKLTSVEIKNPAVHSSFAQSGQKQNLREDFRF